MAQETCSVQTARRGNLLSPVRNLPGPHHQRCPQTRQVGSLPTRANALPPPSKEQCDKHEKDLHSLSIKFKDKPHSDKSGKDKEGDKSLQKCPMSPPQWPPSTERVRKEPCLEETALTISVSTTKALPSA